MNARPRTLQIGSGWFPESKGGAQNMYYNTVGLLGRRGFDVEGVVPGSAEVERDSAGRVRGIEVAGRSLLSRARATRHRAAEAFGGAPIDIYGGHFALYVLPVLDRIADRPFVVHFYGPWALESLAEGSGRIAARAKWMIERTVYRHADRAIVMSDAFGRILRERYGLAEAAIRRIPGGVDCARFANAPAKADARAILGWEADRPILVTVRRLVRRTGVDRLVEAMTELPRSQRDAVLYIVGGGPERPALEAMVAALGLAGRVRFAGAMSDERLPLAYRAADLAVVPSIALEGFGLVALEALAAGTPVLVTPIGGLPEVVADLSPALILPGSDPAAIAEGIAASLGDASALPDAAACARYARVQFDWDSVGDQIASVYRQLL